MESQEINRLADYLCEMEELKHLHRLYDLHLTMVAMLCLISRREKTFSSTLLFRGFPVCFSRVGSGRWAAHLFVFLVFPPGSSEWKRVGGKGLLTWFFEGERVAHLVLPQVCSCRRYWDSAPIPRQGYPNPRLPCGVHVKNGVDWMIEWLIDVYSLICVFIDLFFYL